MLLGEQLITRAQAGVVSDSDDDYAPPRQKWKPQSNAALRHYEAIHLPEMVDETHTTRLAMVSYTVTTYTGDRAYSGTNSYVYIQLCGAKAESQEKNLNKSLVWRGFSIGSERSSSVECEASLGELILVKLRTEPFMGLDNEWFCNKITVRTPEGEEILFPCYCWLRSNDSIALQPAKALLVYQETNPTAQKQRMTQLEERQTLIRWAPYSEGVPYMIDYESADLLPAELRFSYSKKIALACNSAKHLLIMKVGGLSDSTDSWESINQLHAMLCDSSSKTFEYVQHNWDKDEFFAYQFLNGLNPIMIRQCSKLPKNFPVTEEMVKDLLGGSTLRTEMKKGNVFLCDYKILDGLVGNVVHGRQQYIAAPLVLLYCNPKGILLPIAIQLMQTPGADNPIFMPTDSKHDWMLAKIFVRSSEFATQALDAHLLRTHLLCEVFAMGTLRHLPSPHPLFKLLIPHTRYNFHINILGRLRLFSDDGSVNTYAAFGGEAYQNLLKRATAALTYSSLCLPDDISERGLENIPKHYYRDDGLKLWTIINKYVAGVLQHYYKSDEDVQRDTELQNWIQEIFIYGFMKNKQTGIPESFQAVSDLIKFVTMVIFAGSGQHTAVNNAQYDIGGWMPNNPTALRKPPPKKKGQTTEKTILETLPDVGTTVNVMSILRVLTEKAKDRYPIGCYVEDLFVEEVPCKLIKKFQKDLKELSAVIEERNKKLELPYIYMDPSVVENSVAT